MAFYRFEAKIIGRENRGRSVVAAAAYRAGTKIMDEKRGRTYDYTRREKGVVFSDIVAPEDAKAWVHDPAQLRNRAEAKERRKDSQLSREFILAVPREISAEAQFKTAVEWARKELVSRGMVAEVSLHHSKSGNNPHVHILCTMRKLDGDGFSAKKATEWDDKATLVSQRKSWADSVNAALEAAGCKERVDHRSLKDRGIDRIPEPKIGVAAAAMKRRGILADPERFKLVRWVKALNAVRPWARAIEQKGEVEQHGFGRTWWERSLIFAANTREAVRETVLDTWNSLLKSRQPGDHDLPHDDREPDISR